MRRYVPQMSPQRRQLILDESRLAGKNGMPSLPLSVHAFDPSNTGIRQALDEHELGLAERAQELGK